MEERKTISVSRRSFIGVGGLAAAGLAASSLVACSSGSSSSSSSSSSAAASATDYKAPPEAIADSDIKETIETEILVIGGGISGAVATATAAEEGKDVVVLQKAETAVSHGGGAAAWNSKAQQELGDDYDPWEAVIAWTRQGENRADLDLLKTWIYNSGPTMDWCMALTNDIEGVGPVLTGLNKGMDYPDYHNFAYPTVHMWMGQMQALAQWLLDYAEGLGNAKVHYSTPAVQLIRENDNTGRVVGAIAQNESGEYIKVEAKNGVILAAGDYGNNAEMRAEYLPHVEGLQSAYTRPDINTGDGQLMGMWIGGFMQLAPHCSNIHYDPPIDVPDVGGSGMPWLFVNKNGKRFCNEDMEYGQLYAQDMNQPDYMHFQVFDDNYRTDWAAMGSGMMKKEPPVDIVESTEKAVASGDAFRADTIEELAKMMEVPADELEKTITRYNQLCDAGMDDDYGKQASRLKPIRVAPFYAVRRKPGILCTLNGIITNGDYQALDEERNVIEGLYVVGNCQGNYFGGLEHQMIIPGMSLGRAMTTGRVAALLASGKEINRGRI
ncbi:MAG: FAD-binding protein [Raoultibacter sp.]